MLEFCVLGPLTVTRDGARVLLRSAVLLRLLAALLSRAGQPVPVDDLLDAVWAGRPPAGERKTLQLGVYRLRQALGSARVDYGPGGYCLSVEPAEVDALRFADLVRRGGDALRRDQAAEASLVLGEALELWRGEPYANLDPSPLILDETHRLNAQRLQALEQYFAAELDLGRHAAIVDELTEWSRRHPYREDLRAQLMLALYRAGRQVESLEAYRDTRTMLADQLGIEPGTSLQRLHAAILRADPALESLPWRDVNGLVAAPPAALPASCGTPSAAAAPVAAVPPEPVPRLLPPDPPGFVGRAGQLAALDTMLTGAGPAGVTVVVAGMPGVGKSALVGYWSNRATDLFPDGQLYVDLRGCRPGHAPLRPRQAVRAALDALGVPARRLPAGFDAQVGLYRSLLARRRALIVLDDVRDAEQVRPLLPGGACSALVTSRNQLFGLVATHGARLLTLPPLTASESRELLAARTGPARLAAEPDAAREIVARCAGLPLALCLVAARAAVAPDLPLWTVVAEFREAARPLDPFEADDAHADLRTAFACSYRSLTEPAARLFRLLGLHPGGEIGRSAIAALHGAPARAPLAELVRAHLLQRPAPDRYRCHDLLHAYARELAGREPEQVRRDALGRLLDHYAEQAGLDAHAERLAASISEFLVPAS